VFVPPPLTEENLPLISLTSPITNLPKLEKLLNLPTTTSCEPVRLSVQNPAVDPEQPSNS